MDLYIFNLINQFAERWPVLDAVGIFFARYVGYILVTFVFIIFWRKWKIILQVFGAAILSMLVITNMIRWIFPQLRPFVENKVNLIISQSPSEPSFPSGHASFYFAIAAVVYFYNKKAGTLFLIAASLISLARVFGGIHWPSDILAGALVGIISGWLAVKFSLNKKV